MIDPKILTLLEKNKFQKEEISAFYTVIKDPRTKCSNELEINQIFKKEYKEYDIYIIDSQEKRDKNKVNILSIFLLFKQKTLLREDTPISTYISLVGQGENKIDYDRFIDYFDNFKLKYIMTFLIRNLLNRNAEFISNLLGLDLYIVQNQIDFFNNVIHYFPHWKLKDLNRLTYRINTISIIDSINDISFFYKFVPNNILIIQIIDPKDKKTSMPIYVLDFDIKDFSSDFVLTKCWTLILSNLIKSKQFHKIPEYQKYIDLNEVDNFLNEFGLDIKKKVLNYLI